MRKEEEFLRADAGALEQLIKRCEAAGDTVGERSFRSRLEKVTGQLASLVPPPTTPQSPDIKPLFTGLELKRLVRQVRFVQHPYRNTNVRVSYEFQADRTSFVKAVGLDPNDEDRMDRLARVAAFGGGLWRRNGMALHVVLDCVSPETWGEANDVLRDARVHVWNYREAGHLVRYIEKTAHPYVTDV